MDDNRIDHLLAHDDTIEPSADFAAAVMDAVRAAAGRDLLRFPWRLLWPGLGGTGLCVAGSVASLFFTAADRTPSTPGPDIVERLLESAVDVGTSPAMAWVAFSCLLTLWTVQLSMHIIRRAS